MSSFLSHRRPRRLRRALCLALSGVLLSFASAANAATSTADAVPLLAPTSTFNKRITPLPRLDPKSKAMVGQLSRDGMVYANLYEFGVPIYTATPDTPRFPVDCAMEGFWGACPLSKVPMPIPEGAHPNTGSDGVLAVIDPSTNTIGEYWQASYADGAWRASWGAVNPLSGSGWGGASTAAGASRVAGVVRVSEIQRRSIKHALVLQTDNLCANKVRRPALKTDGTSKRSDCIPAGARVRLDPKVRLSSIKGLTAGERAVARALQVYGAYVIDTGGAPLSISFERASDATADSPGSVYAEAGLSWDYYGMPHVPWHRLQVLRG